jgi:hypothetical protein
LFGAVVNHFFETHSDFGGTLEKVTRGFLIVSEVEVSHVKDIRRVVSSQCSTEMKCLQKQFHPSGLQCRLEQNCGVSVRAP